MAIIYIPGQLLIPFGQPKWDIEKIRVTGVDTGGTYIESDSHCAHIDKTTGRPLTLSEFPLVFSRPFMDRNREQWDQLLFRTDPWTIVDMLRDDLLNGCQLQTEYERQFLAIYFDHCSKEAKWQNEHGSGELLRDPRLVFQALLPLPQAHIYASDPLHFFEHEIYQFVPSSMFKVDFAFWTGKELIAVEVDGASHIGQPNTINRDRMLQTAGVKVIHILNDEIMEFGSRIMDLLPSSITDFGTHVTDFNQLRRVDNTFDPTLQPGLRFR